MKTNNQDATVLKLLGHRVMLAPLAGVSDPAFRRLCRELGAGPLITEMVSAHGVATGRHILLEKQLPFLKYEHPLSVQFVGNDPKMMADCCQLAQEHGAAAINLNMACPAPKVTKNGKGAGMMQNPEVARDVIRAAVASTSLPVTLKIRAGWDHSNINAISFSRMAQDEGIRLVILHPRTRGQGYSGVADWTLIAQLKDALNIPVVGNGDIRSPDEALKMLEQTRCDAVMIGRGSYGRPWLFFEILETLVDAGSFEESTRHHQKEELKRIRDNWIDIDKIVRRIPDAVGSVVLRHIQLLRDSKSEEIMAREMRKHLAWYSKFMPGASQLRQNLRHIHDAPSLMDIGLSFFTTTAS